MLKEKSAVKKSALNWYLDESEDAPSFHGLYVLYNKISHRIIVICYLARFTLII